MNAKFIHILPVAFAGLLLSGCLEHELVKVAENNSIPIEISAAYRTTSRVSEAGFADADRMGIFITDYVNGESQPIGVEGNRANNLLFIFDENENRWDTKSPVYWKDRETPADIIGYYPYDGLMTTATEYNFSVYKNQSANNSEQVRSTYEFSDLLWAKAAAVTPTKETVKLTYTHIMAGVTVSVEEGTGFSDGEWESAVKNVWIDNTVIQSVVDLQTGSVIPVDGKSATRITPLEYNGQYRAVVIPQTVSSGLSLIGITVDGANYSLTKEGDFTYKAGKMHTFTITVNKRSESGDYEFVTKAQSITPWIDDAEFHDGILREYIIVDVETPGTLEQVLAEKNLDRNVITSMKVTGTIDWDDLNFMGKSMMSLSYLNLYEAVIDDENDENDDVITGFNEHPLTKIVLPAKLRGIASEAFRRTNLSGEIILPEGLEFIEYGAFIDCPFNSEIKLPSTLKTIGPDAFAYSDMEGELLLPESLEYLGGNAFGGTYIEGGLTLPQNLTDVGGGAFSGCNLSGDLVIPQGMSLNDFVFSGTKFSHVSIPEGIETIGNEAFQNVPLVGELVLPSTIKELKSACFLGTTISSVVLPDNLRNLEQKIFKDCSRLQGIIRIPDKVIVIPTEVFDGCSLLDGVHFNENVVFISKNSFRNCYSLNTIICDAVTPPVVEPGAFDGVPKDNFSIEVPAEAVSAYRMAEGWKEFKRITAYSDFVSRPSYVCAINTRHDENIILNADDEWEIIHKPDWCNLSQTSGIGKVTLKLTVEQMSQGSNTRRDSIVFSMPSKGITTYCTVVQKDYEYAENQVVKIQEHTKGKGINVIFVGDGYDADALAAGKYMDLVRLQTEYFFGVPPFDRLRDYFNVYVGIALSQEKGINTVNTYRNTKFGTLYGGTSSCKNDGLRLIPDDTKIFDYLTGELTDSPINSGNIQNTLVILVPNTDEYNGITYLYNDNRAISICPPSSQAYPLDTRGVLQREACGFGFGKLANEAVTKNAYATSSVISAINEAHTRGWFMNVSSTGKMDQVPWSHLIFDTRYSDYVDIFEGAYEYSRLLYRSEASSCMSIGIPYFNAISRQTITRRIMELAGETFSLDEFFENDTDEWGESSVSSGNNMTRGTFDGTNEAYYILKNSVSPVVVTGKYIQTGKYN